MALNISSDLVPFPRIRGGDPITVTYQLYFHGFSPHTRG